MEITRTPRAEFVELKLKGRMDAVWSDHVAGALNECVRAGHRVIAVDMAGVDYISSAGIRILVLHSRQLKSIQGRLFVTNASGAVRSVLELAGLNALLQAEKIALMEVAAESGERPLQKITLPQAGATAEVFEMATGSIMRVDWPGNPSPWLEGAGQPASCSSVEFPADVIGLGLGAFGDGGDAGGGRFGEFLAAGGGVVCQPADGSNRADYMLQQGALTPAVKVAYGIVGRGDPARLMRFDKGPEQPGLALSAVAQACLDAVGSDAVALVMVAETVSLVGASLQRAPLVSPTASSSRNIFAFPEVRDWLSFTAEAAFANSSSLVVGFATSGKRALNLRLLKPLVPSGELCGHFHAAAFPYRPLRKGKVGVVESVQSLFESGHVLGVLHLLNDWRDANGAGESRFLRGACWCAPLIT